MKRFTILISCLLAGIVAGAQQGPQKSPNEMKTLFGQTGEPHLGWVIGVEHGYTQFESRDVRMGGLKFGMVIDQYFTIGLSGRGWYNRDEMYYANLTDTAGAYLEGGYGGLLLECTLFPNSPVHITFPVIIGGGAATYISEKDYLEWDEDEWDTEHTTLDKDDFFVIEPGAYIEMNLLSFMKLDAGVSYRYVRDLHMINTPNDMMNNFTFMMGLKFGKF